MNATTFGQIEDLEDFKADLASASAVFIMPATGSSGTNPLIFVLFAGVVVVVLLAFVLVFQWIGHRKDRSSEALSHASSDDHLYSIFNPDFEAHETIRVRLAADPIIVTNRLAYDEVKLGRCISRGGFGLVFTGTYRSRQVAVKKIRGNRDSEAGQIELFIREITLMAMLRHSRIVEFIGVAWEALVDLSAVTELMERGDLSTVLRNCRENGHQLTWSDHKATIAFHIAEALAYLHSLSPKVIHRDLKSKNVLLNDAMEAKLSDFGISRERHDTETHMTAAMGTSFWIAPEVLSGCDYDEKADVFSFGVVLSELDTNDFPYWNAAKPPGGKVQEGEILQLVAAGHMRPSFSSSCPTPILEVATRCLQVRPEARPTAAELVRIFQDLLLLELSSSSTPFRASSLSIDSIARGNEHRQSDQAAALVPAKPKPPDPLPLSTGDDAPPTEFDNGSEHTDDRRLAAYSPRLHAALSTPVPLARAKKLLSPADITNLGAHSQASPLPMHVTFLSTPSGRHSHFLLLLRTSGWQCSSQRAESSSGLQQMPRLVWALALGAGGAAASSSASAGGSAEIDDQVKAWLENYMEDGETRLFPNDIKSVWGSTIGSSLTANWKALPVVCGGKPSVQTKSSALTPNGGCPDVYTDAGVSCTCLEGYDNATDWAFYVQARQELTDQPLTLEFGATLGLTSLVTIVAPDDLTTITIVGVGDEPVTLNVTAEATGWTNYDTSNPSLIEVGTSSALEKM
ncbi:unnamed protein product [Phytophthora fragariaefolia]|uniref:Unnamed protein product n=1 Tax=Phytophthora fragariaefolia TaxID=1490495 RepID=A0A9W6XJM5_9STRA|nr:unnamed protein product [Phytophthora fragariaefolia]